MENKEIERKFLIEPGAFDYSGYPHKVLEQGYLGTHPTIRIRKEDDIFYLTYKGDGGLERTEYNLPLSEETYYHLKEKIDGHMVCKNRYLIPYGKYTIEFDEFLGELKPLLYAEVEFPSVEEAKEFKAPAWFGKDVTEDRSYSNYNLSQR